MALRLWTGPSGSGKTRFLFEYVLEEASKHRELNYLVIVPEQFTLSTQRELIRLSKDHGILNVDVLSFARLAYRIFEETGFKNASGVSIDDMGKNLILRHLAEKCDDQLTVLSGNMNRLGYITEVKSAISEFMQYGISSDRVSEMAEGAKNAGRGRLAAKLHDMEILYKEFNKYIEDKYITKEEILSKASRAVFNSEKIKRSVVVFDGFTGFTPVQYDLIDSLMQIAHDIHVTILTDTRDTVTYNTEHELFYLGYKTSQKLKKLAEKDNISVDNDFELLDEVPRRYWENKTCDFDGKITSRELVHLEKNLFREYSKPYFEADKKASGSQKSTKVVNSGIRVFTALQPIDEVRKVAIEIQKLIRQGANYDANVRNDYGTNDGLKYNNKCIRYKNIAIATGDLENYLPVFKRVFDEYDIPYFIDKTQPVLMNPFIEYMRALMDIISDDFSYSAMFRYLRTPILDYETSDIDRLENFVLKYGIKGVHTWNENWIEKYSRYYKNSNKSSAQDCNEELIALDTMRQKVISELSDVVNLITNDNRNDIKMPTKTVNEINAVFMRVFEIQNVEKRIEMLSNEYCVTDDSFSKEHKKEYEKIYGLTLDLLNRMSELLPDEKITLKEYGELLDAGLDEIRIGVIPSITDYIQIGDITRSRFENIHTLFIVGANDGVIPKSSSGGGIISDIEKEFLINNTPDIELSPTVREQAYTGQLYLYMLMTKPTNQLMISYSRLSSDSESMRPSYIIKVLSDLFPGMTVERDDQNQVDRVFNSKSFYDVLSENIKDEKYLSLVSLLANDPDFNDDSRERLLRLVDAAYMDGILTASDAISKAVSSILYGKAIIGSVTRLEQYAKCSFSYFLKYGLSLKEREIFSFEAKDMGTVFHGVIENYSKLLNKNNLEWTEVSDDRQRDFVNQAVLMCVDNPEYAVLQSTFRHKYMIERISRISTRTVSVFTSHLKAGKFAPKGAELSFSSVNSLDSFTFKLSDDEIMRLSGTIDRLDTYRDMENGKLYIKIIDYKSGDKSLNLVEVYRGLSLQLVVYMNAAMEISRLNPDNGGLDIIPAGILYYHIDDPMVEGEISDSDENIGEKIIKELKMKGLVNSDKDIISLMDEDFDPSSDIIPVGLTKKGEITKNSSAVSTEDFSTISQYVNKKIRDIGNEILSGNIRPEPHSAAGVDENACAYCQYTDICKRWTGCVNELEEANNSVVDKDSVIELMKEELSLR